MSYKTNTLVASDSNKYACAGTCTGYDTCSNCPPLIVLAILANSRTVTSPVMSSTEVLRSEVCPSHRILMKNYGLKS